MSYLAGSVGSSSAPNLEHSTKLSAMIATLNVIPREENELALEVGTVIEVISKDDSGWWSTAW